MDNLKSSLQKYEARLQKADAKLLKARTKQENERRLLKNQKRKLTSQWTDELSAVLARENVELFNLDILKVSAIIKDNLPNLYPTAENTETERTC